MRSKNTANRYVNITVAIALIMFASTVYALPKFAEPYQNAKTVREAIQIAQAKLKVDSKEEYAGLLTELRVRDAILVALRSYESKLDDAEKRFPGSKAHFETLIKPICMEIAQSGEWKANCWFDIIYGLVDQNGVQYEGLLLRLSIETPDAQFKGFSLPIVDVHFGRFGP